MRFAHNLIRIALPENTSSKRAMIAQLAQQHLHHGCAPVRGLRHKSQLNLGLGICLGALTGILNAIFDFSPRI
jgi:hypothetical protein